jgi:hypothetical protein
MTKHSLSYSLINTHPAIALQWDYEKNKTLDLAHITHGSNGNYGGFAARAILGRLL